jgi:hypothetical protein
MMRTTTLAAALLAAMGLLIAGGVAYAAEAEELPQPPKVESPAGPPAPGPGRGPCALPPWLDLTEEQQQELADIRQDLMEQMREKARDILTDTQKAQLDAFAKWMEQRPKGPSFGPRKGRGGPGFACPPCPMGGWRGRGGPMMRRGRHQGGRGGWGGRGRCGQGFGPGRGFGPPQQGMPQGPPPPRVPQRGGWGGRGAGPWWRTAPEEEDDEDENDD